MRRLIALTIILTGLVLQSGCSVPCGSVEPFCTMDQALEEPALAGEWYSPMEEASAKDSPEITTYTWNKQTRRYEASEPVADTSGDIVIDLTEMTSLKRNWQLFELNGDYFVDAIYQQKSSQMKLHIPLRIGIVGDCQVLMIPDLSNAINNKSEDESEDSDKATNILQDMAKSVAHEVWEEESNGEKTTFILMTAPTPELQKALGKYQDKFITMFGSLEQRTQPITIGETGITSAKERTKTYKLLMNQLIAQFKDAIAEYQKSLEDEAEGVSDEDPRVVLGALKPLLIGDSTLESLSSSEMNIKLSSPLTKGVDPKVVQEYRKKLDDI